MLTGTDRAFANALARLWRCNPFLPERIAAEREALGPAFKATGSVWRAIADGRPEHPNVPEINARAQALADRLRLHLGERGGCSPEDRRLYEDVVVYTLYTRYEDAFFELITKPRAGEGRVGFYTQFHQDLTAYFGAGASDVRARADGLQPAHLFALFYQVRRAFHFIFRNILGGSMPAARLRAAVWQSIFTTDLERYARFLHARMADIPSLIAGPSGTGKELVAHAIACARYIPFDSAKQVFQESFAASFHPLNLSALPSTLIESELFGHKRGAFTGAVQDRDGWLQICSPLGTVFLDEIGDVDIEIQVKLLRVLETRLFQKLGETQDRRFEGKIIAATNRNLSVEMEAGRFREDLYYRLCADLITTPSLAERLLDSPEELRDLLVFLARRIVGDTEAEAVADQVARWSATHLGPEYLWPGNVRELEQCLRNILIRGEYRPARRAPARAPEVLVEKFLAGSWTADALLRSYCTLVYGRTGSYQETARRLGLDRRTVREKIDRALLRELGLSKAEPRH